MKVLLDTHCWLWWTAEPQRLGEHARRLIRDGGNTVLLSAASSWELAIKYALGRLALPEPPHDFVPRRLARDSIAPLPVHHAHALQVAALPRHHRDPFDRLLVAQAQLERVPIITVDRQFEPYDIEIIWGDA